MTMLNTPVLLLIFNRPDRTLRVFEEIRKAKPTRLFIAADGPRSGRPGEREKCEEARSIIQRIDWPCELSTLFRDSNLGCRMAVSGGITWFFENVEEGIILEDDCLPGESFFSFCQQMLDRYRDNPQVMHVGGNNFINQTRPSRASWYFSRYGHIWGWATWRRAWNQYDVNMKSFPTYYQEGRFRNVFGKDWAAYYWLYKLGQTFHGKIDTWDYQWTYAIWAAQGKSIVPAENLVTNIGFGSETTHVMDSIAHIGNLASQQLQASKPPQSEEVDEVSDRLTDQIVFNLTWWKKCILRVLAPYSLRTLN